MSDPSSPQAAGSISDNSTLALSGASGIAIFESDGTTYAAVTGRNDGVQILNMSDPSSPQAAGSISDGGELALEGASGIAIFESGGHTYAAVAASINDAVQIINMSDPSSPQAAGNITDGGTRELDGANSIAIFESGGHTYAAVAAVDDGAVQIIDLSDPSSPQAAGSISDGGELALFRANSIAVFESGGHTYAAVAGYGDDGVQIINMSDPSSPQAAGRITDGGTRELDGASEIAIFESGGTTYAAVTGQDDDGVQIIDLSDPSSPQGRGPHHRRRARASSTARAASRHSSTTEPRTPRSPA